VGVCREMKNTNLLTCCVKDWWFKPGVFELWLVAKFGSQRHFVNYLKIYIFTKQRCLVICKWNLFGLIANSVLKMKFDELPSLTSTLEMIGLCRSLPREHFPKMRKFAQSYACLFGTTYKCKQSFSFMKIIKNKLRSRSSHSSLKDCLLLSVTNLTPDITGLVKAKQSQSHIKVICLFCLCLNFFYLNR